MCALLEIYGKNVAKEKNIYSEKAIIKSLDFLQ